MAQVELIMPKMGESIMEATILKWLKKEGDEVEMDETILEIATDKVDSEVPSPVDGKIAKILFQENDTVAIGEVIALIETEAAESEVAPSPSVEQSSGVNGQTAPVNLPKREESEPEPEAEPVPAGGAGLQRTGSGQRFYSPLVRNIAEKESIPMVELEQIPGSGLHGRVTKKDILAYLDEGRKQPMPAPQTKTAARATPSVATPPSNGQKTGFSGDNVEIIEMDRMRRMIADHMVQSKQTSPHVTSFVEADVTNIVNWRNRVKRSFQDKYGEKITFTPIFVEAIVKAIHDFPMINISVDGYQIMRRKDINIGMATALPSGNLIVPVIKKADRLSLVGLTERVNELANRARNNQLKPEDIQDGTFTLTNVGTFGNVMGTPIINQPQAAILATGAIRKKPAVVETPYGDLIAVRQLMFLSLSYDHRVIDGFLGGSFLRRIADYLEGFDPERTV